MIGYNLTNHIIHRLSRQGEYDKARRMHYLTATTATMARLREIESRPVVPWFVLDDGWMPTRYQPIDPAISAVIARCQSDPELDNSGRRVVS